MHNNLQDNQSFIDPLVCSGNRHKQLASPSRMWKAGQITIIGLAGGR
jgi:hypothetical protein